MENIKILVGERVKLFRQTVAGQLEAFEAAKCLSVSNSTLSKVETGKRFPSVEMLLKGAEVWSWSIDWLLTGNGAPICNGESSSAEAVLARIQQLPAADQAMIYQLVTRLLKN